MLANPNCLSVSLWTRYRPRVALASALGVAGSSEMLGPAGHYTDEKFMAWLRKRERVGFNDVDWAALCALPLGGRAAGCKPIAKPGADGTDQEALRAAMPLSDKHEAALDASPQPDTGRWADAPLSLPEREAECLPATVPDGDDKNCGAEAPSPLLGLETGEYTDDGPDWPGRIRCIFANVAAGLLVVYLLHTYEPGGERPLASPALVEAEPQPEAAALSELAAAAASDNAIKSVSSRPAGGWLGWY